MNYKKLMIGWGCLDLCSVGWFLTAKLFHGHVPFYHDIVSSFETSSALGVPKLAVLSITVLSLLLYISMGFSGFYLIRQKKLGAILSYIQAPFRILTIIPASIFFLTWPLKYIVSNPKSISTIVVFYCLVLFSETLKTVSIFMWQRGVSDAANDAAPLTHEP